MKKVCMVVQNPCVKGGIASVVNGYRGSQLEKDYKITYIESYRDGGKLVKLGKALKAYFKFINLLIFDKPDIVHIHSSFGPSFYRKIPFIYMSVLAKIPIVNHVHGSEFNKFYLDASEHKKRLVKKVWNRCDSFIVLYEGCKKDFLPIIPSEKIHVIDNYSIPNLDFQKHECHNQIMFLGAVSRLKGCFDIPQVVKNIKQTIPDVKMVIAGDGETKELEEEASKKDVLDNFVFTGWIKGEEKKELFKYSDVLFLPSYTEAMPMSVLEGIGYGLPVVSTNVGGIPKIVLNGENGYVFAPGDIEGFSKALTDILNDSELRTKFSIKSYDLSKTKYSIDKHIEKIEKIYSDLLSNK